MIANYYSYLQDVDFLKRLDKLLIKEKHLKITILDKYERAVDELTGYVKDGGSVSMDGSSAIRRTCSLTLVSNITSKEEFEKFKELISINKKIQMEVGIKNITKEYKEYDILWFPMGIFYIQNPSFNETVEGYSISLSLSDKMCLLNGESGGVIPADIELDRMETFIPELDEENNKTGKMILSYSAPIQIRQIIYELVNHMGGEQLPKIIVDIPDKTKVVKAVYGEDAISIYEGESAAVGLVNPTPDTAASKVFMNNMDVGFGLEPMVYPSDKEAFIATKGSSIVDNLNNLSQKLDNYEFFYDKNGNFIFQEIKNYLNTSESTYLLNKNSNTIDYLLGRDTINYSFDKYRNKSNYEFDDNSLIISCSNNPQYELIKNDFIIWGTNSAELPIRYHVTLDETPNLNDKKYEYYFLEMPMVAIDGIFNEDTSDIESYYTQTVVKLEPLSKEELNEMKQGLLGVFYYVTDEKEVYIYDGLDFVTLKASLGDSYSEEQYIVHEPKEAPFISKTDWRTQYFLDGVCLEADGIVPNDYYIELKQEWAKIIDVKKMFREGTAAPLELEDLLKTDLDVTNLQYFVDILDTSDKISEFNVSKIGKRTEIINESESGANCIFENDIPGYIYIETNIRNENKSSSAIISSLKNAISNYEQEIKTVIEMQYIPVLLTKDDYNKLITGGRLKSAYEVAKDAIYKGTGYNEKITLDTIPIYYLEPNTRITINNEKLGINGDYIINSVDIPLDAEGTMSLICSRALDKL